MLRAVVAFAGHVDGDAVHRIPFGNSAMQLRALPDQCNRILLPSAARSNEDIRFGHVFRFIAIGYRASMLHTYIDNSVDEMHATPRFN